MKSLLVFKEESGLVEGDRDTLKALLREMASAQTEDECSTAEKTLRQSSIYKDRPVVKNYLDRYWLCIKEVRFVFFRSPSLNSKILDTQVALTIPIWIGRQSVIGIFKSKTGTLLNLGRMRKFW